VPVPAGTNYADDPIPLMRDVAKINVRVITLSGFNTIAINQIRLYNYNYISSIVAMPELWESAEPIFSIDGVTRPAWIAENYPITYSGKDIDLINNQCVDEIFTRESAAENNLFLLVNGDVTIGGVRYPDRWFKLDFRAEDPNVISLIGGDAMQPINILRNYTYNIAITGVSGLGYSSPTDAYNNLAEGLAVDLIATPEPGMNDTVYNGKYQLTVNRSSVAFPSTAGTQPLKIFTDYSGGWKIGSLTYGAGTGGWLSYTPGSTSAANPSGTSTAVTLTANTPNPGPGTRTATFVITAGNLTKTIAVSQDYLATLSVNPTTLSLDYNDTASKTITVTTNATTWTVTSNHPEWITLSPTSGSGNSTFTITCTLNDTGVPRTAIVTVTAGGLTQDVTVTQDALASLAVDPVTLNFAYNATTGQPVAVTLHNIPTGWSASSDQAWAHIAPPSGTGSTTVTVTCDKNDLSTLPRTATITFTALGVPNRTVTVTQDGMPALIVTPTSLNFDWNASAGQSVNVSLVNITGTWSASSDQSWATITPLMGADGEMFMVTCTNNTDASLRTATITVTSGGLNQTVTVTQSAKIDPGNIIDSEMPADFMQYVGAFWKANQVGERLIRDIRPTSGSVDGDWTASVIVGDDWIVLDTQMTTDPNVGWRTDVSPNETNVHNGNDANFDTQHPVNSTLTTVSGTMNGSNPQIYFRIGLKSTLSNYPSVPARYGIVLLTYKNNTMYQRIWIRQGEGDDYLMRNQDPILNYGPGGTLPANRTQCKRFSPYNLTASDAQWAAKPGGPSYTDHPQLAVRGGTFTKYPSQGGANLQWGISSKAAEEDPTILRRAYFPVGQLDGYDLPGYWEFTNSEGQYEYWDDISAFTELCPPSYHRPTDGATNRYTGARDMRNSYWPHVPQDLATSEIDQSLMLIMFTNYLTALTGNISSWGQYNMTSGFYADGFFDRRVLTLSGFYGMNKTVSYNASNLKDLANAQIAFQGVVFYNPYDNASIFFPCANVKGYRAIGSKNYEMALYNTSTGYVAMEIGYNANGTGRNHVGLCNYKDYYTSVTASAGSIRCVRD